MKEADIQVRNLKEDESESVGGDPLGGKNPSTRQDPHKYWLLFRATRQVTRQSRQATRQIKVVYQHYFACSRFKTSCEGPRRIVFSLTGVMASPLKARVLSIA